jgi:hypothetical protein
MVSHASKTIVTFVGFKWNQAYIATTLCENKEKPALKCNGKCYLRKQIEKEQESEDSPLLTEKGQFFDCFIQQEVEIITFSSIQAPIKVAQLAKTTFFRNVDLYAHLLVTRIFRPPSI